MSILNDIWQGCWVFLTSLVHPSQQQLSFLMKASFLSVVVMGAISIFNLVADKRRQDVALGKLTLKQDSVASRIKQLQKYRQTIYIMLHQRKREHMTDHLFWITLGISLAVGVYLLFKKQVVLALLAPLFFLNFFKTVMRLLTRQDTEDIEEQLPVAIDSIVRVSSKYDDLKTIFYEASKTLENPMKGIFSNWATKMSTHPIEKLLLQTSEQYNSIWLYSFTFILIGYVTNSTKEETIKNLRHIRQMLYDDNLIKKQQATERKYGVVINYVIVTFSVVGFIANLIFNPVAEDFFFGSIGGIACLIAGVACIFTTILLNLKLVKKPK